MLVVDDELFCLETMKTLLAKAGVDTETMVDYCVNGAEALYTVKEGIKLGISYKLILTDFSMPGFSGIEWTR